MANNLDRFNTARARSGAAHAAGGVLVDASELNQLAVDLQVAGETVGPRAQVAVAKSAVDVERWGKAFAPVDTGFMRSSIGSTFDGDRLGAQIGPTASYAAFVELGTSRMAPRAFMGPALDRVSPDFVAALEQIAGTPL